MKRRPWFFFSGVFFTLPGLSFILLPRIASAQPETLWTRSFGGTALDCVYSLVQTSDGGLVFTGVTRSSGAGEEDVWLVKTDASGNQLWERTFGGPGSDIAYSVQQTSDGGFIIAGFTSSYGAGGRDVWLIKTDASGDLTWQKTYGGSQWDEGRGVLERPDGGYVIVGYTSSYGVDGTDVWLFKTDSQGVIQWSGFFGGPELDAGLSVAPAPDGGLILTGYTTSSGAGNKDVWLIKTSAGGQMEWNRTFGGFYEDSGRSVRPTADGGYILAGYTLSYIPGNSWAWLIKTDPSGSVSWDRFFGGDKADQGNSVLQTSEGGFIVCGSTNTFGAGSRDVWLVKTDATGSIQWDLTFGGADWDEGHAVLVAPDGGFFAAGSTRSFGAGSADGFLIRTAPELGLESGEDPQVPWLSCSPNPARGRVAVSCRVAPGTLAVLSIYDLTGRLVATLFNGISETGAIALEWSPGCSDSGICFARLSSGGSHTTAKILYGR